MVVVDPVEGGVGNDQIDRFGCTPAFDLGHLELQEVRCGEPPCVPDHLFRSINADDFRLKPPLEKRSGQFSGPAPEVDDKSGVGIGNCCDQMAKGQGSFIRESEVLVGIPGHYSEYDTDRQDGLFCRPSSVFGDLASGRHRFMEEAAGGSVRQTGSAVARTAR